MDFARKQLEKYGWSEGKGLGKSENGMVQPLKPKPKHGSGGIGHDLADEFTNHWWQKLYNKASENIEIKKTENGEVHSILTKNTDVLDISTQKFVKPKKTKGVSKTQMLYNENFVKRATLTNGSIQETELSNSVSSDDEINESNKFTAQKLTDDELFAACGGRTAHKGARHGLRLNGKLARIVEHEENVLKTLKAKNKPGSCEKNDSSIICNDNEGTLEKTSKKNKNKTPLSNEKSQKVDKAKSKRKRKHTTLDEETEHLPNIHIESNHEGLVKKCKKKSKKHGK